MEDILYRQSKALLSEKPELTIASLANVSSLMFDNIDNINWIGFYLWTGDELVLGPFAGKVACTKIQFGKGVCGGALSQKQTLVVDNVHDFPGHIACDSASNSEIVVPLFLNDKIVGVLDIDSPMLSRFGNKEKVLFEKITKDIVEICGQNIIDIFQVK